MTRVVIFDVVRRALLEIISNQRSFQGQSQALDMLKQLQKLPITLEILQVNKQAFPKHLDPFERSRVLFVSKQFRPVDHDARLCSLKAAPKLLPYFPHAGRLTGFSLV